MAYTATPLSLTADIVSNPAVLVTDDLKANMNTRDHCHRSLSGFSLPIAESEAFNPYISASQSTGGAVDSQDGPPFYSVSASVDSPSTMRLVDNNTAAGYIAVDDADCKWDMSLFNFPTAIRNENIGRFPWVGNPTLAWEVVLRVLHTRFPPKPFYPKDPRVSKGIWAVLVVQKNRAASNRIIKHVAAIYARTRRVVTPQHPEDDEIVALMKNISVRDTNATPKLPWICKEDPTWAGILMALDILFATNPSSRIDDAELRMNYMRVSRYATSLVRCEKPWLAPEHVPRYVTPLRPFPALRVALSSSSTSVKSCLTNNGIKRKQEEISKSDENGGHDEYDADADIEDADETDDEIDDDDAAHYNQRLKRARID